MKTYTLTFDENQLNLVASALAELPYKVSQPIINSIQAQLNDQAIEHTNLEKHNSAGHHNDTVN